MNTFGRIFRVSVFGESHGEAVGVCIDGCPAGLPLHEDDFRHDLDRRRGGAQKGTTPRKEEDIPQFTSGVFNGMTTGSPLTIIFPNRNADSRAYSRQAIPRPGHADLVATQKFGGFEDYRGGGHFSGRLTVSLVAAGVVAKKLLPGISIQARIIEAGGEQNIEEGIEKAIKEGDSVGGIVECRVNGLPPALGEPFFDPVESLISHLAFSVPAIKGIEFGSGFGSASMFGSSHNDAISNQDGLTATNHAGGVTGGLTTGNELVFRVAVKPTSSTPKIQKSWSRETGNIEEFSVKGRHDLCIALRVPPVMEAVAAIVIADLMMLENRVSRVMKDQLSSSSKSRSSTA